MEKYSKYLLPTLYVGVVIFMVTVVSLVISGIKSYALNKNDYKYTLEDMFSDIEPVMKEENDLIVRPYIAENVKIGKYFYDYETDEKKQQESLILFENTYLQNTGVDYISEEIFDITSILDGEIIGIEENEVYGKIITIKHNDNLITTYGNVKDVLVNVGYKVSKGEIIARSNKSKIDTTIPSLLHFEVEYKGELIDPENLYTLKVSDLN